MNRSLEEETEEERMGDKGSFRDLEQRVAARTKELAALNAVAQTASRSLELTPMLHITLDKVLEVLEFESGAMYLKDLETGQLQIACHRGLSEGFRRVVAKGIISARAAESGNPIIIDDLAKELDAPREIVEEGYRSVASIPLLSKGQVQGVLTTASRKLRRFQQQHVDLLVSIGHQIGVAIENAWLYEDTKLRLAQLTALQETTRAVASTLELDQVLNRALDETLQVMDTEAGGIYLLDEEAGVLTVVAHRGMSPEFVAGIDRLKIGEGFSGRVVESGQPLLVGNVSTDPRLTRMVVREAGLRSVAIVPLSSKGKVLGTLFAFGEYREFSYEDVQLLTSIGHQIGVAIENARLYEDTKRRLAQLTALQETTRAVASTLELDQLLNLIIQQATALLQADGGILNLVDWEKNEDEAVACIGLAASLVLGRSPLEGSLSGWVALNNQPVISNQVQNDSRVNRDWLARVEEETGKQIQNGAVAPLAIKNQVIGTLVVMDKQGGRGKFDQSDLDLLVAFANQAATAIENARLYEQAQHAAVLEERQRLARDLHDAVTQTLFSASLVAEVLPRLWKRNQDEGERRLEELGHLTRGALAEMRTLLLELRPEALVEASLDDLLRQLTQAIGGRARLPVELTVDGERPLPADVQVALYRVAQEALNNVARHAGASQVAVSMCLQPEQVELRISDDGRGFDPDRVSRDGLGLGIMRERAESIDATLTIESQPGYGTRIAVIWLDPTGKEHL